MTFNRADYENEDSTLQAYAWPGGYPIYYLCADSEAVCPDCANCPEAKAETINPTGDKQWQIIGADINWEDNNLLCANCNRKIESAYGSDSSDDTA